jgi:hypothetical protein
MVACGSNHDNGVQQFSTAKLTATALETSEIDGRQRNPSSQKM